MSGREATELIKERLAAEVDRATDELTELVLDVYRHPELGFKETRTSEAVVDALRAVGYEPERGLAVTGMKASIEIGTDGPTIAVLGELDALPVPDHPDADPVTGAAHACGHHLQLGHLVGVARALATVRPIEGAAGRVVFIATPAEEYVDVGWRADRIAAGDLSHAGGKQELVSIGAFDDVDIAMMVHASTRSEDRRLAIRHGNNGFLAKEIEYAGRSAHAAAAPHLGINALTAARLGLQAIDAVRDTFMDDHRVRVHAVMSDGGAAPNVVPDRARLEMLVRAASLEAIVDASAKVDRALRSGAMALGATVRIGTRPGYLPVRPNADLEDLFRTNAQRLVGADGWADRGPLAGSTDIGDLSHLMPVLHPYHGGCSGANHSGSFRVADWDAALIAPTKALLRTIVDLLVDDAAAARRIIAADSASLTKAEYLAQLDRFRSDETWTAPA
jgi:amidohydrolase